MVVNPYTWGLGRRKSAVARVRIKSGSGNFVVNGKPLNDYFTTLRDQKLAQAPFGIQAGQEGEEGQEDQEDQEGQAGQAGQTGMAEGLDVFCNVRGGGPHGQAGAVQLGLARALKESNPVLMETLLREHGLLTRDPRMKERKKYGRRGARRGFQWCKR